MDRFHDSLAWLKSPSSRWQIFVANRTLEIQETTSHCAWKHIPSEPNPADYQEECN